MGAVAIRANGGLTRHDSKRVKLFTQTVGKDLVGHEIDEAIEWCEIYGANPFVKDIYFFTFGKYGEDGRRVVPVLSIGMYRKIASRAKNYRPDDKPPRITYDEKEISQANPRGIVSCELSVFMHSHGEWHRVTSCIKWDERAPIIDGGGVTWEKTGEFHPQGHRRAGKPKYRRVVAEGGEPSLDPGKKNWATMPETMLAKCVEADAIRKAWPEETAGSYAEGELDRADTIELMATEILEDAEKKERLERIGGPAITILWNDHEPLARVPVGKAADRIIEFVRANREEPMTLQLFADRNKHALQELWAMDKAAAFAVKKEFEALQAVQG